MEAECWVGGLAAIGCSGGSVLTERREKMPLRLLECGGLTAATRACGGTLKVAVARKAWQLLWQALVMVCLIWPSAARASDPKNISNSGSAHDGPIIAVDRTGKIIDIVWRDVDNHGDGISIDVFHSRSTDGGLSFSAPTKISNSYYDEVYWPRLAVDRDGNINIAWVNNIELLFRRSSDSGLTFSPEKTIDLGWDPQMALDSRGRPNVVWIRSNRVTGCDSVVFARSDDSGATFSETTLETGCWPYPLRPQLLIDSRDNINIAWISDRDGNDEIHFTHSTNGGASFSAPASVASGGVSSLRLAVDAAGNTNVVWEDNGYSDFRIFESGIYLATANSAGADQCCWDVTKLFGGPTGVADVALEDVALDTNSNLRTILLSSQGISFISDARASYIVPITGTDWYTNGLLAVDGANNITVVWGSHTYDNSSLTSADIFYTRSIDGATFSLSRKLSTSPGLSYLGNVAVDGAGSVHVVYQTCADGPDANCDIFYTAIAPVSQSALHTSLAGAGSGTITSDPVGIGCNGGGQAGYAGSCNLAFASGTTVTLTATATDDSLFTGWGGDCSGTAPCVLTMDADHNVTATFELLSPEILSVSHAGAGGGTVSSAPVGISCGAMCSASFAKGAAVTLNPVPDSGSYFAGWAGACSGTAGCIVTMDADKSVTANFNPGHILSTTLVGNGNGMVSSSPPGISCGSVCTAPYAAGTLVTLTAVAASGSTFAGWSGACSGKDTCTVTMDAAKSVTAAFAPLFPLFITIGFGGDGSGGVSDPDGAFVVCSSNCTIELADGGHQLTLQAMASYGSYFGGWGLDCAGDGDCTLQLDGDKRVNAYFYLLPTFALSISRAGSGNGTVTSSPVGVSCGATCTGNFPSGTVVTLTPVPSAGSIFSGWNGACRGTHTCTFTMDAAKSVTATFNTAPPITYALTGSLLGTGSGTVTSSPEGISCGTICSASFESGTAVTLTPITAPGSTFAGWGGACTGTGACTLTMDAAKSVTATFKLLPDTTAPTILLTGPLNNSTVSGSAVSVSATATDNVEVLGVQFKLDGANLGAEVTAAPYSTTWNTTLIANGNHTLTAQARDAAGNIALAVASTVTVSNSTEFVLSIPAGSAASVTANAGAPAVFSLNIVPTAGFTGTASFTCSNLPPASTCTVAPNPVNVSGNAPLTVTVTITTTARSMANSAVTTFAETIEQRLGRTCSDLALFMVFGLVLVRRRDSTFYRDAAIVLVCVLLVIAIACGGGGSTSTRAPVLQQSGTPAGTYTINMSATAGSVNHSLSLTLFVN